MKSLMEVLYDTNIRFIGEDEKRFNEQKESLLLVGKNEERLKKLLTQEGEEILAKLLYCHGELSDIECRQNFISGFRMGGRIVAEVLMGEGFIEPD